MGSSLRVAMVPDRYERQGRLILGLGIPVCCQNQSLESPLAAGFRPVSLSLAMLHPEGIMVTVTWRER